MLKWKLHNYVWYTLNTPDNLILNVEVNYATLQLFSGSCANLVCIWDTHVESCTNASVITSDSSYFLAIASASESSPIYELFITVEIIKPGTSCNAAESFTLPLYTPISTYISTVGASYTINDACYGPSYKSPTFWTKINVYSTSGSSQFQLSINTCSTQTEIDTLIEVANACSNGFCYAKSAKCSGTIGAYVVVNLSYGEYYVGYSSGNSTSGEIYSTYTAIPL